jgi:hypothetical protein
MAILAISSTCICMRREHLASLEPLSVHPAVSVPYSARFDLDPDEDSGILQSRLVVVNTIKITKI